MTADKKWIMVGNIFITLVVILLFVDRILGEKSLAILDLVVAIFCVPACIAHWKVVIIDPSRFRIFLFLLPLFIGALSILAFFGA